MGKLTKYIAKDRRVYNGALCSDMSKERNHEKMLEDRMKQLDPTASCTYFPMEGQYLVFVNSKMLKSTDLVPHPIILTGNFHTSKQDALIEAIERLDCKE